MIFLAQRMTVLAFGPRVYGKQNYFSVECVALLVLVWCTDSCWLSNYDSKWKAMEGHHSQLLELHISRAF